MRYTIQVALFGACFVTVLAPGRLGAQACKDEEGMATEDKKSLTEVVDMVKKESLQDFQRGYHQKSCLNKLTFSSIALNGLVGCLDKAVQDTTAEKEDIDSYKAKRETYGKLKDRIEEDRKALKTAADAKEAKAVIEKFNYSN
jgi:uncharacterized protein YaiL (DUF2058 family)